MIAELRTVRWLSPPDRTARAILHSSPQRPGTGLAVTPNCSASSSHSTVSNVLLPVRLNKKGAIEGKFPDEINNIAQMI